eukprot:66957_1
MLMAKSLYDYKYLEISPYSLDYNKSQRTFIGAECDFSFTASLIHKRVTGSNIYSTSLFTKEEWNNMIKNIAINEDKIVYKGNLLFCKMNKCKTTFGVDGTNITKTQNKWNDKKSLKFDRIIYTFPRKYKSDKTRYNDFNEYSKENEILFYNLLNEAKSCLNTNGEIHFMIFPNQFRDYNINYTLSKLNLKITALADLSKNNCFYEIFPFYTPRDSYGNYMNLYKYYPKMWKIYICCFKMVIINTPIMINNKYNKYLYIYGLWKGCTEQELYDLF